jgi:hypothetical protein
MSYGLQAADGSQQATDMEGDWEGLPDTDSRELGEEQ